MGRPAPDQFVGHLFVGFFPARGFVTLGTVEYVVRPKEGGVVVVGRRGEARGSYQGVGRGAGGTGGEAEEIEVVKSVGKVY